jgi:hypothetical protein
MNDLFFFPDHSSPSYVIPDHTLAQLTVKELNKRVSLEGHFHEKACEIITFQSYNRSKLRAT